MFCCHTVKTLMVEMYCLIKLLMKNSQYVLSALLHSFKRLYRLKKYILAKPIYGNRHDYLGVALHSAGY